LSAKGDWQWLGDRHLVAGGKGRVSRRTPDEILARGNLLKTDPDRLVYVSKMSAKVDSAAVQDGYQLYHHVLFFDREGKWAVVQQGMNEENRYARRYHWLGLEAIDFVCEPHQAVCCDLRGETLNLVAKEGDENRKVSAALAGEEPERLLREYRRIETLELPRRHAVTPNEVRSDYLSRILVSTYERRPENFEALLGIPGVGAKTLRSLSLLAELLYGAKPSFRDPVRFSYAHGGKDGHPYPVDREIYDRSIHFLRETLNAAKIGETDRKRAFERLTAFAGDAGR
jgi:hypothetical protein